LRFAGVGDGGKLSPSKRKTFLKFFQKSKNKVFSSIKKEIRRVTPDFLRDGGKYSSVNFKF